MNVSGASPNRHCSPLALLAALSALITLALAGGLIVVLGHHSAQSGPPSTLAGGAYIGTAQTASGVHQDGSPVDALTSFNVGQTVYIAYTVTDAGPGLATIKLYDNGVFIDTQSHQFPQRSSYNAYFSFPATQAGDWEADLYWQQRGASGEGTLEQRVTFLVGNTSTLAAPSVAIWLRVVNRCTAGIARSWYDEQDEEVRQHFRLAHPAEQSALP